MSGPQGYTKKQSRLARQEINISDIVKTSTLAMSGDQEIVELGMVASTVTLTTVGGLTATASFSIDGVNYYGSTSISSTPITYNTNLVKSVKIVWASNSGMAVVAAK